MTEDPQGPAPAGRDEAQTVELGEPERMGDEEGRPQARPDLDAREERISPRRKPAGPPLRDAADESPPVERTEPAVDPD